MKTVTANEAGSSFDQLLGWVQGGEEVTITRNEIPVARIVPAKIRSMERVRNAGNVLRELQQEISDRNGGRFLLSDDEIRSAIEEGRS